MIDAILIRHSAIRSDPIHAADIELLRRRWPRIEEVRIEPPKRDRFDQFDETYPWTEAEQQ
ncbi:MAG TPA: hypothetical protein VK034_30570 [Enhygromyxa sp.]|nr:hypothetical protein [Enhygromyxa sp.]